MCPSSTVTYTDGVHLALSKASGSRSITTELDIHAACGCVLSTSMTSSNNASESGRFWPTTAMRWMQVCALHAEQQSRGPVIASLQLFTYTDVSNSLPSTSPGTATPAPSRSSKITDLNAKRSFKLRYPSEGA